MSATAIRTGSVAARDLLADAAVGPAATLAELLDAARRGDRRWLRRLRPRARPAAIAALARTIALQDRDDRRDALALYALVGDSLSPAHQALHARLALAWDGPDRAAELLDAYRRMPPRARAALSANLLNPFVAERSPDAWLPAFQALFPDPPPTIGGHPGRCAFERLGPATPPARVEAPQRVSVIVDGVGSDVAMRSILAQTWRNVEVIPGDAGPAAARGEFVAFQDADDWSHPGRLERQIAPLLADRSLVASTSRAWTATSDLLIDRARRSPSSLVLRRSEVLGRVGPLDRTYAEYLARIEAVFGAGAVCRLDEPLALTRKRRRPQWISSAEAAYRSACAHWHTAIAAGEADPANRPVIRRETRFDVVLAGDWRFATGPVRSAVDEMRALAAAGMRVGVLQLDSFRRARRRRRSSCAAVQELVNTGVVAPAHLTESSRADLLLIRQAEVLAYAADDPAALRAGRVLVVADRADAVDRPAECAARAERVFGAPVRWCPQDPGVREALPPGLAVTDWDLPAVVDASGWHARRTAATADRPIVGADLCDSDPIGALAQLSDVDVRVRLADTPPDPPAPVVPPDWLVFAAAEVAPRPFAHQLDFYLHVPRPAAAETLSRPALEAAAAGCVVILPERSAALYGDAAVYAEVAQVAELIRRYAADRELYAEQSRRARQVVPRAHHPELFVAALRGNR